MEIEYEDDEVVKSPTNKLEIQKVISDLDMEKFNHVTNTKDYDPTRFDIISPEEATIEIEQEERKNPNQEFTTAIKDIVKIKNAPLTKEEYIKAADAYATILAERDEEKKKNYEGKIDINPIKKETYLNLLLSNKPVTNALAESMKMYEDSIINPIMNALEKAQKEKATALELKKNKRVNLRYKGKCRIATDEGGKVIIIDNKNDVDLLRMKYRKEWIDKRYPEEIKGKASTNMLEDDEFE
jgi:hypothetical protein